MSALSKLRDDARVLWHLMRGQRRHGTHAERLQAFYGPQADRYDAFRERLLHGRAELIARLIAMLGARHTGATLIELGGGTGRNLDFLGPALTQFGRIELVDLCPALLERARARWAASPNVHIVEADVVTYRPAMPADALYFSYALTMIPDWRGAIDNALAMLRPGGCFGVVDFYVSAAAPPADQVRHGRITRAFWPRWFAHDGVMLGPERLALLRERLPRHELIERRAPVPYLPSLRVPYFLFLGIKD